MSISSIGANNQYNKKNSFRGGKYENPINRKTEKGLAVLGSVGSSALVGTIAAGIGSCFVEGGLKANKKLLGGVGLGAGLLTLALTLPSKLYNTNVNAFAREKEMDVFTRDRDLKSNIMEEVNDEVKNKNVDLDKKIKHYTSVQMANNGKGLFFAEV